MFVLIFLSFIPLSMQTENKTTVGNKLKTLSTGFQTVLNDQRGYFPLWKPTSATLEVSTKHLEVKACPRFFWRNQVFGTDLCLYLSFYHSFRFLCKQKIKQQLEITIICFYMFYMSLFCAYRKGIYVLNNNFYSFFI